MGTEIPAAVWIVVAVAAAIVIAALIDLLRSDVRLLAKWAWAILILVSFPLGAILYVALGRAVDRPCTVRCT